MRHYAVPEKRVDAVPRTIHELIRNHKLERLVFFFQRSDGGHRKNSLYAELFESMNVGAEVEFARQNPVAPPVTGKKGHLATFQHAQNVRIRRRAERGFQSDLSNFR